MTYYDRLEVNETASQEVIHMAYKALSKKYHPDVYSGDSRFAEENMKQINAAYEVLSNPSKRAEYDLYLKNTRARVQSNTASEKPSNKHAAGKRKRKGWKIVLILCLLAFGGIALYSNYTAIPDIETIKDSVVMINLYDEAGDLISTGSGFCAYQSDYVVTNYHVIEGAYKITIITDDSKEYKVNDILIFNQDQDLAILRGNFALEPIAIQSDPNLKAGQKVTAIGSPKGQLNTVSTGVISNADNEYELRITAPISPGSSGGVLLNEKNQVIGVTYATYDALDSQNINYAISVKYLENIYSRLENGKFEQISLANFSDYFSIIDRNGGFGDKFYSVDRISTLYLLTNERNRFEYSLQNNAYDWYSIYSEFDDSVKEDCMSIVGELDKYSVDDSNVADDIEDWDVTDFFLSLNVLSKYEYAIVVCDLAEFTDKDLMFDRVDNYYPLDAAEKSLILYLVGGYEWSEIHTDNKEDIFDYFDARYGTEDFGAILEVLGYEVEYNSDGTLTAYW